MWIDLFQSQAIISPLNVQWLYSDTMLSEFCLTLTAEVCVFYQWMCSHMGSGCDKKHWLRATTVCFETCCLPDRLLSALVYVKSWRHTTGKPPSLVQFGPPSVDLHALTSIVLFLLTLYAFMPPQNIASCCIMQLKDTIHYICYGYRVEVRSK